MKPSAFIAKQLQSPSGILGREVLSRLWNRRNAALNDLTLECLELGPHDRVLEVGFGGGYLLDRMSVIVTQGWLAGVDASPEMVVYCQRRFRSLIQESRLEVCCAGAEVLPYPVGHFTKACSVNSIFYWNDLPQAMAELYRVLEVGGRLALTFTCKGSLQDRSFARHGLNLLEDDQVQALMETAGFCDVEMIPGADRHREFICSMGRK